ncbi:MAG: protein translocase subunit SecF [Balneolales bacterium]
MRLFETADFTFIPHRKIGYVISGILITISLFVIIFRGLNYGIDFKGGTDIALEFENPVAVEDVREILTGPLQGVPEVKLFGSDSELLIRTDVDMSSSEIQSAILGALGEQMPGDPGTIIMTNNVGPAFAEDMRNAAFLAILFSLIVLFLYILIRFKKWSYSAGAVAALAHDVIITLGVFTILYDVVPFDLSINQALIAAFLTIVGYSLNDTVVVYDRIRENSNIFKTETFDNMVNKSINNTLSRTVVTSLTTLFVVTILFIFGGEVLRGFSFALMLGVILGTYSSIFIASGLLVDLQLKTKKSVV